MERVGKAAMIETPLLREAVEVGAPARFLARRPILDAHLRLFGYELVARPGPPGTVLDEGQLAAQRTIRDYRSLIPEGNLALLFVPCGRAAIVSGAVNVLPSRTTVLELTEDLETDDEVVECCRGLRARGYRFAMEGFRPVEARRAYLPFADFVKIDLRRSDAAERKAIYEMVRSQRAKWVATHVATQAEMEQVLAEGCHYFQGYFFAEARAALQKPIRSNQIVYVRVLAALSSVPQRLSEVERIILSDPTLCYRLLRLVNSALYSLASHVTSIKTALVLIGYDGIRKLVTVALAGMYADRQPKALSLLALERAHFCESIAPLMDRQPPELYLLGMLSLIDVMLQAPMQAVLDALPLSPEFKGALCGEGNDLGRVLLFLRAYEAGDWEVCDEFLHSLGMTEEQAAGMYVEAVHWAATALVS